MKRFAATLLALLPTAGAAAGQQGAPNSVQTVSVPGVRVRFLNFGWNPEAFAAMETGGSHPAASRPWALAVIRPEKPLKWEGQVVPHGAIVLILNPKSAGGPMTIELRHVDLREVFSDLNVIAIPPAGQTVNQVPANFETVKETLDRLKISLAEAAGKVDVSIHYGNRELKLELAR